MQQRHVAARFVELQFASMYQCSRPKGGHTNYGVQEARELLDFIYGGPPLGYESRIAPGPGGEARRAEELKRAIEDCK